MDDEQDLFALVRSCFAYLKGDDAGATGGQSNMGPEQNVAPPSSPRQQNVGNDDHTVIIPGLFNETNDPFLGLADIYKQIDVEPQPENPPQVIPNTSERHQQIAENQPLPEIQAPPPAEEAPQGPPEENLNAGGGSVAVAAPVQNPQPRTRIRKRKSQQLKEVHSMTEEELASDSWAWRKYGQKPIKGSPYPRNYYRCSSSKGCAARRQVERSPTDPDLLIVSYYDEHTHPRPTQRSALAGISRNRSSPTTARPANSAPAAATNNNNNDMAAVNQNASSSSSSSISPITPLPEGDSSADGDAVATGDEGVQFMEWYEVDDDEDDPMVDDELLINHEIYKQLEAELRGDNNNNAAVSFADAETAVNASGGDDKNPSNSLPTPPWRAPTTSANGGGGC